MTIDDIDNLIQKSFEEMDGIGGHYEVAKLYSHYQLVLDACLRERLDKQEIFLEEQRVD